jgi:hypothetical protein
MIKISFSHIIDNQRQIKSFDSYDLFLSWYFKGSNDDWLIETILEGKEHVTGENIH